MLARRTFCIHTSGIWSLWPMSTSCTWNTASSPLAPKTNWFVQQHHAANHHHLHQLWAIFCQLWHLPVCLPMRASLTLQADTLPAIVFITPRQLGSSKGEGCAANLTAGLTVALRQLETKWQRYMPPGAKYLVPGTKYLSQYIYIYISADLSRASGV